MNIGAPILATLLLTQGAALSAIAWVSVKSTSDNPALVLSCALFPADLNAQRLSRRFGAVNVVSREINLGEGDTAPGTVLFPDDRLRRVEIAWEDQRGQRQPQVIRVSGDETLWRTPQGITLRTTLEQVRRLNGKPVRILSFDRTMPERCCRGAAACSPRG
jgi:hypothetical protein